MNTARILALLEPYLTGSLIDQGHVPHRRTNRAETSDDSPHSVVLAPAQLDRISTYIDLLIRWNARVNLTAILDPEEIVTRHFGESLFAARHLLSPEEEASVPPGTVRPGDLLQHVPPALTVADVGSGAGFPGLPMKLWAPHISLTLIESNHKKAAFLREATRALTLTDVNVQTARAETLAGGRFDLVTLRAVERFEFILPVAAALVAPSGRLALLIGTSQENQARASLSYFVFSTPVPVPGSRSKILLIGHGPRPPK